MTDAQLRASNQPKPSVCPTANNLPPAPELLMPLQRAIEGMVQDEVCSTLTLRQLAILLICSTEPGDHTVRALAARLGLGRSAITQAFDRLTILGLLWREVDKTDRRNVFGRPTSKGRAFIGTMSERVRQGVR